MHLRTKNNSSKLHFNIFSKKIFVLIFCITITFMAMSLIFSLGKINKIQNKNISLENEIKNKIENITKENFVLRHDNILTTNNGKKIFVQLATTSEDKRQGLSGKEKLNDSEGMLFVFKNSGVQDFWMKDMNFDLDMIFLDDAMGMSPLRGDSSRSEQGGLKIVHIEKNALASSYNKENPNFSKRFSNGENKLAKYVLEINAGLADKMNLKEGDIMLKY